VDDLPTRRTADGDAPEAVGVALGRRVRVRLPLFTVVVAERAAVAAVPQPSAVVSEGDVVEVRVVSCRPSRNELRPVVRASTFEQETTVPDGEGVVAV
jgi:hypothetical protein